MHLAGAGGVFYICQVKLVCTFVQFFCFLVTLLASGSTNYGKRRIEVTIAFELSISSFNSARFSSSISGLCYWELPGLVSLHGDTTEAWTSSFKNCYPVAELLEEPKRTWDSSHTRMVALRGALGKSCLTSREGQLCIDVR